MATTNTTKPDPKAKKEQVSLTKRITSQLDRAVLGRKITKEELTALGEHLTKLQAFLG